MTRESALSVGRRPGQLERVYIEVFDRLARMLSQGGFPFPVDEAVTSETPRVGDGVLVLDASARVDYASPNAVNALHRMGVYSGIEGVRLDEAGLEQSAVSLAYQTKLPSSEEVGKGDIALVLRCIPLLDTGTMTGALVLMRDVSDLRRRDRLLLSKDVAIREVHHRVKNNLQTISSLLRLQSRRMPPGQARHALEESERRVRSIAVVHEILSRDTTDEVDFNDILPSLVRMAEDLGRDDRPVRITYRGEAGALQAAVATPLAVVITELLQNAAEHAWPDGAGGPQNGPGRDSRPDGERALQVDVELYRTEAELRVIVRDNGVGLPSGFSIEDTSSLGLSIVRGLVGTQLGGTITMSNEEGTVVDVVIPVDRPTDDLENL
jgi:two-component sensor histidine kinase